MIEAKENELKLSSFQAHILESKQRELQDLERKVDNSQQKFNGQINSYAKGLCEFHYKPPFQQFNRNLVYGRVGTLFTAKDLNKYGVALTEVIGGRIYNVVVESSNEAKQMLKGSELQQRVTFMPLRDIVSKEIPRDLIQKIEEITQGRAKLAIDLIQFDPKFTKIMQ